ncbi:hypothetical protein M9458_004093, partial [Cirrhinus mrigala]
FKQGYCDSQRGCGGNAGQLRSGLLPHEVLHWPYERFQECGAGVCEQQTGQDQGSPLYGGRRNRGYHFPHSY